MMSLPSIPAWDRLHPAIVHFPIGLLLFAPLPVVVGAIDRQRRTGWIASGLLAMWLGVVAAFVTVWSGEAAAELVSASPRITASIQRHEKLAEGARNVYLVIAAVLTAAAIAGACSKPRTRLRTAVWIGGVVGLVMTVPATLLLLNAAHEGGSLVHDLGVSAPLAPSE